MKNHVIHARIDQNTFYELEALKEKLGVSKTTDLITLALHRLFIASQQTKAKKSPFERIEEAGLIGCVDNAEINASRDAIKSAFLKAIEEKIADRHHS